MLLRMILTSMFVSGAVTADAAQAYKKAPRDQITRIAGGQVAAAERYWEGYLSKHPDDLEAHYGLAICYAHQGRIADAMAMAKRGVARGLPFERFLAGPRDMLKPPYRKSTVSGVGQGASGGTDPWPDARRSDRRWRPGLGADLARSAGRGPRIPSRGLVSSTRGAGTNQRARATSPPLSTSLASRRRPATIYQVTIAGKRLPKVYQFVTMPTSGAPAKFTLFFGGGAGTRRPTSECGT